MPKKELHQAQPPPSLQPATGSHRRSLGPESFREFLEPIAHKLAFPFELFTMFYRMGNPCQKQYFC